MRAIIIARDGITPRPEGKIKDTMSRLASIVNRALQQAGAPEGMRIELPRVNPRGATTALFQKQSTATATHILQKYRDAMVTAARKIDGGITDILPNENWTTLKLCKVPLRLYGNHEDLQILREEIEAENQGVTIPTNPRWIASPRRREDAMKNGATVHPVMFHVVDRKTAARLLTRGAWVAGRKYKVEPYLQAAPDALCGRCAQWGHIEPMCGEAAACRWCTGGHTSDEHQCPVAGCERKGRACKHTIRKCVNCPGEAGLGHCAPDSICPARKKAAIAAKQQRYAGTGRTSSGSRDQNTSGVDRDEDKGTFRKASGTASGTASGAASGPAQGAQDKGQQQARA